MSDEKKKTSIAQKINGSWLWSLFVVFMIMDLALLITGGSIWLYLSGQDLVISREILWKIVKWGGGSILLLQLILLFRQSITGYNRIQKQLKPVYDVAQAASELSNQRMKEVQRQEAERFRAMEDAIDRISPKTPDAKLDTGDTDLRGLETAINNLVQRMHDSYRQQVRFVSDASHELRTPIAVIQGYANMLDRWGKTDSEILEEGIQAIKSESATMNRLVEQLLFLARGDSGRQPIEMKDLDAKQLAETVYEEYSMIDSLHVWKLHVPEESMRVCADDAMLKQALRILMDNAAKYTPEGGQIRLRLLPIDAEHVAFEVTDQGIGIRQEDVNHVFERFYRADPARDRKTGGSGLGLSIASWIAQQHEGYLNVLSYEDIGTRMTLVMPVKTASMEKIPASN